MKFGQRLRQAALGAVLALAASALTPAHVQAQAAGTGVDAAEIEAAIRQILRDNPEIVIDALRAYQAREEERERAEQAAALAAHRADLLEDPAHPDNGVANADVTLVEFFDYQCGYCKRLFPSLVELMDNDAKLRVVFLELPILGPASRFAARAALAAHRQDEYFRFHAALMDMRGSLTEDRVLDTAASLGLDIDRLRRDMADPAIDERLDRNLQIAHRIGVSGTPAMIVGDHLIPGAVGRQALEQIIAEVREERS